MNPADISMPQTCWQFNSRECPNVDLNNKSNTADGFARLQHGVLGQSTCQIVRGVSISLNVRTFLFHLSNMHSIFFARSCQPSLRTALYVYHFYVFREFLKVILSVVMDTSQGCVPSKVEPCRTNVDDAEACALLPPTMKSDIWHDSRLSRAGKYNLILAKAKSKTSKTKGRPTRYLA